MTHLDAILAAAAENPSVAGAAADYLIEMGQTLADVLMLYAGKPPDYADGCTRGVLAWVDRQLTGNRERAGKVEGMKAKPEAPALPQHAIDEAVTVGRVSFPVVSWSFIGHATGRPFAMLAQCLHGDERRPFADVRVQDIELQRFDFAYGRTPLRSWYVGMCPVPSCRRGFYATDQPPEPAAVERARLDLKRRVLRLYGEVRWTVDAVVPMSEFRHGNGAARVGRLLSDILKPHGFNTNCLWLVREELAPEQGGIRFSQEYAPEHLLPLEAISADWSSGYSRDIRADIEAVRRAALRETGADFGIPPHMLQSTTYASSAAARRQFEERLYGAPLVRNPDGTYRRARMGERADAVMLGDRIYNRP